MSQAPALAPFSGPGRKLNEATDRDPDSSAKKAAIKPELPDLCADLDEVASSWSALGINLRFSKGELSKIQDNHGGTGSANKVYNCFVGVLDSWKVEHPNKFNKDTLVKALKLIDHGSLAEQVKKDDRGFNTLSTKDFCEMLTTCKAAYEMLGVYLGVGRDKIKEIQKMSGPGDCVLCMSEMLDIYLREKHFDLEEVCNALEKVDRKGLSEKFRKKYEGPPPVQPTLLSPQGQTGVQQIGTEPTEDVDSDTIRRESAKERGTHTPQLKLDLTETTTPLTPRDHKQMKPESKYYPMTAKKHGVCLIINNIKFEGTDKERKGSERDEHNLVETWQYLGYRVEVRRNCSLAEITKIFDEIDSLLTGAKDVENDSFVCCILSHGKEHLIVSSDKKPVKIADLECKIGNSKVIPEKPKMFFVQACRTPLGTKPALPTELQFDSTPKRDIYVMYATSLGDPAVRHPIKGSWFVKELCKLLCEFAKCCSLHDIELDLNRIVREKYEYEDGRQQPRSESSLDRDVHFFHTITGRED